MESPAPLWTGIPCTNKASATKVIRSHDLQYAMLITDIYSFKLMLLNLTNGEFKNLTLPDINFQSIEVNGAFSPDNRYFIYSVNLSDNIYSGLYLLDLAKSTNSILFKSPCATYSQLRYSGGGGSTICADIGLPQWIDDSTVVFSGYSGDMPETVESGVAVDPNRTFIMDVEGNIHQEFSPALYIGKVSGPTLLFYYYGKSEEGYKWLDTADLKQGVIKPHLLDVNGQFRAGQIGDRGYLELPDISPDGQLVIQQIDGKLHLIGLRSGSDTEIRSARAFKCTFGILWSPDQKNIKCQDVIISLEGFADQKILDTTEYSLFAWLP
ncbi:MAG: hypothetical protein WBV22_06610 [Anaerolineaceae bacterium]